MVIGSSGMLGREVVRVLSKARIPVFSASRAGPIRFDAEFDDIELLAEKLGLGPKDYLINCVGWIPQKATGSPELDISRANLLNVELPRRIRDGQSLLGFTWVQIATDCVFNGGNPWATETQEKDANDLYGLSKIAGEKFGSNSVQVRASIIGYNHDSPSGLYAWALNELRQGRKVPGFTNQLWNGVTTTAFARMVLGLIESEWRKPLIQHWLPTDHISKFELLQLISEFNGYSPNQIVATQAETTLDRRIGTVKSAGNELLWSMAGYKNVPAIRELVAELVLVDKKIGSEE